MNKTTDLGALSRYVYGIIAVVTVLMLFLIGYLYLQYEKVFQLERRLTTFHLQTIVALNIIDRELNEIEKNIIRGELSAQLQTSKPDVQRSGGVNRYPVSAHLHLINTRLNTILNWQREASLSLFETTTGQLQAAVRTLKHTLEEAQGADPDETGAPPAATLQHTQNLVEQLRRLHLKESAKLGDELLRLEHSNARNIGVGVVLVLLIGAVVVGRLLSLLKRTLAQKKTADAELYEYRDHLEERVAERSRELEASNRELESYSYSIAHDLRTPLRTVTSFSQILQEDASLKLNAEEKQSLERVIKAGKHMARLIDDILELSRISRAELELQDIDLSRLARDITTRLDQAHPDLQVQWHIQEGLSVTGSRLLMDVCLDNLFSNAWKYTSKINAACIEFGSVNQDGETVYFVRDNGIGIDMKYADKLFKPFQRLEKSDDYPGTGVGLATVERVIQRHGGRIWATSERGKGATFLFTLST